MTATAPAPPLILIAANPEHSLALQIGYDAVPNLKYSPIDPVVLLLRATTAVRTGIPEPGCSWMRRFNEVEVSPVGAAV